MTQRLESPTALNAWLQKRGDARVLRQPAPERTRPLTTQRGPLEALLDLIGTLARQYGWEAQYSYNTDGPDAGLHVSLVRPPVAS